MFRTFFLAPLAAIACLSLSGCGTPQAKLRYTKLPGTGSDGSGYPFVVPRTVIRVAPTFDKNNAVDSVSVSSVPVSTTSDGKSLPAFLATDSSSGWSLTPTTVSAVSYVDDLIINVIGTQVSDNTKDAVDVLVGAAGLAGAFASTDCSTKPAFRPFIIKDFKPPSQRAVPDSNCWLYTVDPAPFNTSGMQEHDVANIASDDAVSWFPIPVCRPYTVTVFPCDATCTKALQGAQSYSATISVSDGSKFRKVPLPAKGKITLHADFCGADTTNDGSGSSNWGALKEFISDVKSEKKK